MSEEEFLRRLTAEYALVPPPSLEDRLREDLSLDSLELLDLLCFLEDLASVTIDDYDVDRMTTLRDAYSVCFGA